MNIEELSSYAETLSVAFLQDSLFVNDVYVYSNRAMSKYEDMLCNIHFLIVLQWIRKARQSTTQ